MTTILILSIVGILAILAELVLPGGILGIAGGLCLVAAVFMTFVSYGATAGIIALVLLIVFLFLTMGWWMKNFDRLPFTKQLVLHDEVSDDDERKDRQSWIGREGNALTDLHPSGTAMIGEERIDVIAESAQIEKGESIIVTDVRGPSLIVRARG